MLLRNSLKALPGLHIWGMTFNLAQYLSQANLQALPLPTFHQKLFNNIL